MKKRGKLINWIFYAFVFGFIFIGILGVREVEAADSTKSTTMTNEEVDQFIVEDGTEVISDYTGYNAGRGTELATSTIDVSTGKTTTDQAIDSIKLPNSLRKIGENVFCDVLGDLTIPEGIEEIGNDIVKSVTGGLILPSSLQEIGTISTKIVKFQGKDVEIGGKSGKVETVFELKGGKIEQFCKENNIQFVSEEDAKLQKDWFKLNGIYVSLSDKAPSWLQKDMYEIEWADAYSKKIVAKKFATGSAAIGHTSENIGFKKSTCTSKGYTGDVICKTCGTVLEKGHETNLIQHTWDKGKVTTVATYWRAGVKTFTCVICNNHKITVLQKIAMPKTGTKYIVGGNTYVVTKAGSEVSFIKTNTKTKSTTIPIQLKYLGLLTK